MCHVIELNLGSLCGLMCLNNDFIAIEHWRGRFEHLDENRAEIEH